MSTLSNMCKDVKEQLHLFLKLSFSYVTIFQYISTLTSKFSAIILPAQKCSQGYLTDTEDNLPSHWIPLGYDTMTHCKPWLLA